MLYDNPIAEELYDEKAKWWYLDNGALYRQMERNVKQDAHSTDELLFLVFCMEAYVRKNSISRIQTYALFKESGLVSFLKKHYEILHTQAEDYILEEIRLFLKKRKRL